MKRFQNLLSFSTCAATTRYTVMPPPSPPPSPQPPPSPPPQSQSHYEYHATPLSHTDAQAVCAARGKAVQVDPLTPMSNAPVSKRLKVSNDKLLPSFAFNFSLRRYSKAGAATSSASRTPPRTHTSAATTSAERATAGLGSTGKIQAG